MEKSQAQRDAETREAIQRAQAQELADAVLLGQAQAVLVRIGRLAELPYRDAQVRGRAALRAVREIDKALGRKES